MYQMTKEVPVALLSLTDKSILSSWRRAFSLLNPYRAGSRFQGFGAHGLTQRGADPRGHLALGGQSQELPGLGQFLAGLQRRWVN